jgi:hypothetical protein
LAWEGIKGRDVIHFSLRLEHLALNISFDILKIKFAENVRCSKLRVKPSMNKPLPNPSPRRLTALKLHVQGEGLLFYVPRLCYKHISPVESIYADCGASI